MQSPCVSRACPTCGRRSPAGASRAGRSAGAAGSSAVGRRKPAAHADRSAASVSRTPASSAPAAATQRELVAAPRCARIACFRAAGTWACPRRPGKLLSAPRLVQDTRGNRPRPPERETSRHAQDTGDPDALAGPDRVPRRRGRRAQCRPRTGHGVAGAGREVPAVRAAKRPNRFVSAKPEIAAEGPGGRRVAGPVVTLRGDRSEDPVREVRGQGREVADDEADARRRPHLGRRPEHGEVGPLALPTTPGYVALSLERSSARPTNRAAGQPLDLVPVVDCRQQRLVHPAGEGLVGGAGQSDQVGLPGPLLAQPRPPGPRGRSPGARSGSAPPGPCRRR